MDRESVIFAWMPRECWAAQVSIALSVTKKYIVRVPGNARKPQIWPVSLNESRAKKEITIPCPWFYQFIRWSESISMQNFRPFSQCVFPGNAPKSPIWPVPLSQSDIKRRKINRPWPEVNLQAIPSMHSPGNARRPQIWPVALSQHCFERRKMNRPWP